MKIGKGILTYSTCGYLLTYSLTHPLNHSLHVDY